MIKNELNSFVEDVDPVNDRLITMTLKSVRPISILSTYSFTSNATEEEKNEYYEVLKEKQSKCQTQGPTYTMGDFNARPQIAQNATERNRIRPHTFNKENDTTHD